MRTSAYTDKFMYKSHHSITFHGMSETELFQWMIIVAQGHPPTPKQTSYLCGRFIRSPPHLMWILIPSTLVRSHSVLLCVTTETTHPPWSSLCHGTSVRRWEPSLFTTWCQSSLPLWQVWGLESSSQQSISNRHVASRSQDNKDRSTDWGSHISKGLEKEAWRLKVWDLSHREVSMVTAGQSLTGHLCDPPGSFLTLCLATWGTPLCLGADTWSWFFYFFRSLFSF